MSTWLRTLLDRLTSSRTTLLAILPVVAAIAVLALVMAFHGTGGRQFVGSWQVHDPVSGGTMTVRISRTADGFELQVPTPGVAPIPYHFKDGKLWPAPGYESASVLSLVGGKLVMTPPDTPAATPKPKATQAAGPIVTAQPTSTPQPTSTGQQDPNAQQNDEITAGIRALQVAVQSWAVDHQSVYPTADLVASTGAFAAYVQTWPTNPVTGQPMKAGTGAGDYTYEQVNGGQGFRLTGYGVDGTPLVTAP